MSRSKRFYVVTHDKLRAAERDVADARPHMRWFDALARDADLLLPYARDAGVLTSWAEFHDRAGTEYAMLPLETNVAGGPQQGLDPGDRRALACLMAAVTCTNRQLGTTIEVVGIRRALSSSVWDDA
jgi:hypothetical protein